jgi:hypothetical protein
MRRFLVLLVVVQSAHSAVVSNTNVMLMTGSNGFAFDIQYTLTIEQYPPPGASPTSIFLDQNGQNLIYRGMNLDGGSYWYFASLNDQFTANSIAQGQFTLFNQLYNSFPVPYGDFYLGVRTFSDFGENIQGFGWAQLNNSVSGLTLLGSAITYDQPGIVIGTTTTIPEAGPMMLLLPAVTIIGLARRGRRPHQRPSAAGSP